MTLLKLPRFLNKRSVNNKTKVELIRNQIDFFWSSRLRRSFQIYHFYQKWNEKALREFLKSIRNNILNRNRKLLFSAVGLFTFDWDKERIKIDETVQEFFNEFDRIECLKSHATFAKEGPNGLPNKCMVKKEGDEEEGDHMQVNDLESWEFYVQKSSMITWRREEEEGHYAYKVYVSYPDITAEDFLFVQTDIEYRREWDDTAIVLDVIDNDNVDGANSQVIYWEMLWPKLFSNRDYVFVRKHFIDRQRNLILIVNKSTKHPNCPVKPGLQRVKEYWSFMVIKPKTTFDQPGLEFILTYFDNPGIKIPKYVTSWVAQRQLPDFIEKLYHATLQHAERKTNMKWGKHRDPGFEYPSDVRLDDFGGEEMEDNVNRRNRTRVENESDREERDENEESEEEPISQSRFKSWWSYLVPYNYLH